MEDGRCSPTAHSARRPRERTAADEMEVEVVIEVEKWGERGIGREGGTGGEGGGEREGGGGAREGGGARGGSEAGREEEGEEEGE